MRTLNKNKFKKTIAVVLLIFLFLIVINFFFKPLKEVFYFFSEPIFNTFNKGGKAVSNFIETIGEIKNLKEEKENLLLENKRLLAENLRLRNLEKENQALKELMNLNQKEEFKFSLAEIIAKNPQKDIFYIDKGEKEGLKEGMPVVTSEMALFGKIDKVYKHFSQVISITSKDISFNGKILTEKENQSNEIQGVVKGKGNSQMIFDLIPQKIEINLESPVLTTGLEGFFPSDVLVGFVKEVEKSDIQPFQKAKIIPAFEIRKIKYLLVITNF